MEFTSPEPLLFVGVLHQKEYSSLGLVNKRHAFICRSCGEWHFEQKTGIIDNVNRLPVSTAFIEAVTGK
jgi:hypothetical protein